MPRKKPASARKPAKKPAAAAGKPRKRVGHVSGKPAAAVGPQNPAARRGRERSVERTPGRRSTSSSRSSSTGSTVGSRRAVPRLPVPGKPAGPPPPVPVTWSAPSGPSGPPVPTPAPPTSAPFGPPPPGTITWPPFPSSRPLAPFGASTSPSPKLLPMLPPSVPRRMTTTSHPPPVAYPRALGVFFLRAPLANSKILGWSKNFCVRFFVS